MIRRALWLGVGIAVGAIVVRKLTQAARAYSPASLAGQARTSATGLLGTVRDFVADVREGMVEREEQIHDAFARGTTLEYLDDDPPGSGYLDGAPHGAAHQNGAGFRR